MACSKAKAKSLLALGFKAHRALVSTSMRSWNSASSSRLLWKNFSDPVVDNSATGAVGSFTCSRVFRAGGLGLDVSSVRYEVFPVGNLGVRIVPEKSLFVIERFGNHLNSFGSGDREVVRRSIKKFSTCATAQMPAQLSGRAAVAPLYPNSVRGFRVSSSALYSSGSSQNANGGKSTEAMSKVAGESAKSVRGGPVSWASLGLLVVTGVGLILLWEQEKKRQLEVLRSEKAAVATQGPGVGKAAIGGPFKLLNQDGKIVTDRDFLGNWSLIYFGFTYCPDICPDELTKLAAAIDKIENKTGLQVLPIFISIDPERDTVEQVREYLKEYHPRFVGLTGTVEDIRQVAREYRVYYMKTEDEGADYLVDHSIITYLMDPDMNFVKFFGKNYDADSLADGVMTEIKNTSKR